MCSGYQDKLDLSCNWKTTNDRSIKDTVTFGNGSGFLDSGLAAIVSFETCVQLHSPDSSSSTPELSFNVLSDFMISVIKIFSEARIIELYGKGGEYVSTTRSEFLDDFEGMAVYSTMVELTIPSSECSVKFKKLKNQDNFWIYGIGICTQPCQDMKHGDTQVNFKSVNERLHQSGCDLSENAEQCWKLLQTFQTLTQNESQKNPNFSDVDGCRSHCGRSTEAQRKICELLYVSPKFSHFKSIPQAIPSFSPLPDGLIKHQKATEQSENTESNLTMCHSANSDVKAFIDAQFHQLENSLITKVEERLKKIEDKLDMMMLLIQMKPATTDSQGNIEK